MAYVPPSKRGGGGSLATAISQVSLADRAAEQQAAEDAVAAADGAETVPGCPRHQMLADIGKAVHVKGPGPAAGRTRAQCDDPRDDATRAADVAEALKRGCSVHSLRAKQPCIIMAAWHGMAQTCAVLLDAGADIEAVNSFNGRTALAYAAAEGYSETVHLLLDRGADARAVDTGGYNVMQLALAATPQDPLSSMETTVAVLQERLDSMPAEADLAEPDTETDTLDAEVQDAHLATQEQEDAALAAQVAADFESKEAASAVRQWTDTQTLAWLEKVGFADNVFAMWTIVFEKQDLIGEDLAGLNNEKLREYCKKAERKQPDLNWAVARESSTRIIAARDLLLHVDKDEITIGGLKYNERDVLGEGRFGVVYHGTYDGRPCAVKKVWQENRSNRLRTIEIEHLMKMTDDSERHRNVVLYMGYSDVEETKMLYIIMERCNESLTQRMQREKMTVDTRLGICRQLIDGLRYVHSASLVENGKPAILHRDIKPDNLLFKDSVLNRVAPAEQADEFTTPL